MLKHHPRKIRKTEKPASDKYEKPANYGPPKLHHMNRTGKEEKDVSPTSRSDNIVALLIIKEKSKPVVEKT